MAEPCRELWRAAAGGTIESLAILPDGGLIFVGTKEGALLCLDRAGALRWRHELGGAVRNLALAEAARQLLVGAANPNRVRLLDFDGQVRAALEGCGPAIAITPDARLLWSAAGRERLRGFSQSGEQLWDLDAGGRAYDLTLAPDGQSVAYGTDRNLLERRTLQGRRIWFYKTRDQIWRPVRFLPRDEGVVACSNDRTLHCVSPEGARRWTLELPDRASAIAVASAGREIAVGTNGGTLLRISDDGAVLWRHQVEGEVTGVALSADGRFLAGGAQRSGLLLLDCEYEQLWRHQNGGEPQRIALTPDGRLLAAAGGDGMLTLYENPAAPADERAEDWRRRGLVRQLRRQFVANRFLGIARWFDEFDRSLQQGELAICHALLKEIREPAYGLDAEGLALVESREAALLLRQGLEQQRLGEPTTARATYEQSLKLHRRLGHREGEGQALAALATLDQPAGEVQELLAGLRRRPQVLGSSDNLLASWLPRHGLAEQLRIIGAAAQLGMAQPLLRALELTDGPAQMAVAAALARLDPGPAPATVAALLGSERWFVRWQALVILAQQADKQEHGWRPEGLAPALDALIERHDAEPAVRRELARLLGATRDPAYTAPLVAMLRDEDAEVRLAAADALAACGTRAALPALGEPIDGNTVTLRSPRAAAAEAARAIGLRHPLPRVQELWLRRGGAADDQPAYAQRLFASADSLIEAIATLSHPSVGLGISWRLRHEGQVIVERELITTPAAYRHVLKAEEPLVVLTDDHDGPPGGAGGAGAIQAGLIELLDGSAARREPGRGDEARQLCLPLEPAGGRWAPGAYELELSVEGKQHGREAFRVVRAPVIEDLRMYAAADNGAVREEMSSIFFADRASLTAIIELDDAPRGIELRGQLQTPQTAQVLAESQATTTGEGRQQVLLRLSAGGLPPGDYHLVVGGAGATAGWGLSAIDRAPINRIVMCDRVDTDLRPEQAVSTYRASDQFVCAVETGAVPPGTTFTATWYADGQQLAEPCHFRAGAAGAYRIAYALRPEGQLWPSGMYEVVVDGPGDASDRASFGVRAGLRDRVAQISSRVRGGRARDSKTGACAAEASGIVIADAGRAERMATEVRLAPPQSPGPVERHQQHEALRAALAQDQKPRDEPGERQAPTAATPEPAEQTIVPADLLSGLADQLAGTAPPARPDPTAAAPAPRSDLMDDLQMIFGVQPGLPEQPTGATPPPRPAPSAAPPGAQIDLMAGLQTLFDDQAAKAKQRRAQRESEDEEHQDQ